MNLCIDLLSSFLIKLYFIFIMRTQEKHIS